MENPPAADELEVIDEPAVGTHRLGAALLGRAGLEPATATPAVQGTAALASQPAPRPATRRPSQVVAVENQLRRALGVKVVVHANGKGAGRIVIPFADLDEFQRLLDQLTE